MYICIFTVQQSLGEVRSAFYISSHSSESAEESAYCTLVLLPEAEKDYNNITVIALQKRGGVTSFVLTDNVTTL